MKKILQTEFSECGLACLAMIASHHGSMLDLADLRRRFSISSKGTTLAQLIKYADVLNFTVRPLRLELNQLSELAMPCILHWNLNHFIVLRRVRNNWRGNTHIEILDPALGERVLRLDECSKYFTGVALELIPTPAFTISKPVKSVSVKDLTGPIKGLRSALLQAFAMSISLELFAIITPLFNQIVVDNVIASGDLALLKVLVLAFGLVALTRMAIELGRSWFLMRWGMQIAQQWSTRVFSHMLRLPISFFEKRHLGDLVSRFGSISSIQTTITNLFVESTIDGIMALAALAMMLTYSARMALIVIAAAVGYAALRWLFYRPLREAVEEKLTLSAKENSHFLESLRGILPLKLFGREAERLSTWRNLKIDVANRDIKTQKMDLLFKALNTTISSVQNLAIFYLGAAEVTNNTLTIGMLMAFSTYSSNFSTRVFSLIDVAVNVKMLRLFGERLADITEQVAEPELELEMDTSRLEPSITLKNLKFRYGDNEPWILNGVNLEIKSGESVALVGASGCGKTTLCKILLGLIEPSEGEVLIDNIPLRHIGLHAYRQIVGTVMQNDALLTGSILENICFFDTMCDVDFVESCAILAAIHDEIVAMPMGYHTLVNDMGASLSGGQKQRVLLARALYKRPKILALDEATSHLDVDNEKRVNYELGKLALTRIMVAHRPETIRSAGRVISLDAGTINDITPDKFDIASTLVD